MFEFFQTPSKRIGCLIVNNATLRCDVARLTRRGKTLAIARGRVRAGKTQLRFTAPRSLPRGRYVLRLRYTLQGGRISNESRPITVR